MRLVSGVFCVFVVFLLGRPAFAQDCSRWKKIADSIDPKNFFVSQGEVLVHLDTFEQARNLAMKFPGAKTVGADFTQYTQLERFTVKMESSSLKGKQVGWEQKLPTGGTARYRLDWSPTEGAHFNVEFLKVELKGSKKRANYKAKILFPCGDAPCSEAQILKLADQLSAP